MKTFTLPYFAALLRHDGNPRAPAHFQILIQGEKLKRRGMSDPQTGKAWHRASQTHIPLGRGVDSATRLGKRATFRATLISTDQLPFYDSRTDTHRDSSLCKLNPPCTRMYTHPFFEATPPRTPG